MTNEVAESREAAHPGPPSGTDREARRERALHALDQITHCLAAQSDPPADLDAAEVVSDSLSDTTPFASLCGEVPAALTSQWHSKPLRRRRQVSRRQQHRWRIRTVKAPLTSRHRAELLHCRGGTLARRAQHPARAIPGYSWLYVTVLHAGAGTLSACALQTWRAHPVPGPRFEELATTLRRAPPAMPRQRARSVLPTMPGEAFQQTMRLRQRRWTGCLMCLCHCKRPCFFFLHGPRRLLVSGSAVSTARVLRWGAGRGICSGVGRPCARHAQRGGQAGRLPPTRRGRRQARRRHALCDHSTPPSEDGEGGVPVCPTPVLAPWQVFPRQPGSRLKQ